jgi:hypothetical protein
MLQAVLYFNNEVFNYTSGNEKTRIALSTYKSETI